MNHRVGMVRGNRARWAVVVLSAIGCTRAAPSARPTDFAHDFSTAEGAVLCLEDALRAKDVERAVACKEFRVEAATMLELPLDHNTSPVDLALIEKTARVLEQSFRRDLQTRGFPDLDGVKTTFGRPGLFRNNVVVVNQVERHVDGGVVNARTLVAKTEKGWRVLKSLDK